MSLAYTLIFILSLSINSVTSKTKGEELADLINDYRATKGLSRIPFSTALMKVAKLHVEVSCRLDSLSNRDCWNPHSWDDIPGRTQNYETCCYSPRDGKSMPCMWEKPREIANFDADGFEITAGSSGTNSLNAWKKSSGHNDVILQANTWKYSKWKSIGCASDGYTSHCWFATKEDGYYRSQSEPSCPNTRDTGGSISNQPDCVSIDIQSKSNSIEGTYRKSGTAYDGPNGNWLYTIDFSGAPFWQISTKKGEKSWTNGYCSEPDILDCDRKWKAGAGSALRVSSCGRGLELDEESEANNVKNKMWIIGGLLVAVLVCGILFCLFMKKKKRREAQGMKVLDEEELEIEEEKEEDEVVVKFVDQEEVEMGGATTKMVE